MDKEIKEILISIVQCEINTKVDEIYERINQIDLKINRIISKFEYLIELLKEMGEEEEDYL